MVILVLGVIPQDPKHTQSTRKDYCIGINLNFLLLFMIQTITSHSMALVTIILSSMILSQQHTKTQWSAHPFTCLKYPMCLAIKEVNT